MKTTDLRAKNWFVRLSKIISPSAMLILANAVPLVGVVFLDWSVLETVVLYWLESGIIGLSTLVLLFLMPITPADRVGTPFNAKLLLIPFFIGHFSLFMIAHLFLIIFFLGDPDQGNILWQAGEMFWNIPSLRWSLLSLFVGHVYAFVVDYLLTGKYQEPLRKENVFDVVLLRPYKRIVIMQFTVLLGAFISLPLHLPQPMAAVLVAIKTVVDFKSQKKVRSILS